MAAYTVRNTLPPEVQSIVNFEPFSDVPLPTEKKTMGGLKAMYLGTR